MTRETGAISVIFPGKTSLLHARAGWAGRDPPDHNHRGLVMTAQLCGGKPEASYRPFRAMRRCTIKREHEVSAAVSGGRHAVG
jgi:hypothetical protein